KKLGMTLVFVSHNPKLIELTDSQLQLPRKF
ncbi:MAG: hypothetical protein ACI95C_002915, partial [Pseudohongiellaceae bacterium]